MDKYKTKQSAQYSYKSKKPKIGKPGAGAMFIQLKSLKSLLGLKKGGDTMLKPVPADKKKSLGKLPTDVRNKMGYAKKGSMMKARYGTMAKGDVNKALEKEKVKKADKELTRKTLIKRLRGAQVGPAEEAKVNKMTKIEMDKKLASLKKIGSAATVGAGAAASAKEAREIMKQVPKKSKGGEMKQGYGAARTSGMGLQDEDLIPGKSMDYYKDLM